MCWCSMASILHRTHLEYCMLAGLYFTKCADSPFSPGTNDPITQCLGCQQPVAVVVRQHLMALSDCAASTRSVPSPHNFAGALFGNILVGLGRMSRLGFPPVLAHPLVEFKILGSICCNVAWMTSIALFPNECRFEFWSQYWFFS